MSKKPVVIIYRDFLLPSSETFIRSQAEALQHFTPYYVGSRLVSGLPLPEERTLAVNQGGLLGWVREAPYKIWGFTPTCFRDLPSVKPVLIHAHFGMGGALALTLKELLKIPLLVSFQGLEEMVRDECTRRKGYGYRLYLRRREELKREAQLFIPVSNYSKEKLLEQGFPPDKIVVHYTGVDTDTFQPDPTVLREPIVLFVGRLAEKKGCKYLIQAMAQVQATMPDVELVIIGDGPLRLELEGLAAKSLHRYRFLGMQPPNIVRSWMNRAFLFAAPSVTASNGDSEGFPNVIFEAQAMGLPVVSSVHSGIPEIVVHGETGFLLAERDWEGLAKHILLLLEEDTLRYRLSESGSRRVRTLFNLKKQTNRLEEIYTQVLSGRGSS